MKAPIFLVRVIAVLTIVIGGVGCAHVSSGSRPAIHQVGLVWLKDPGDAEGRKKVINTVNEFERSIPEVKNAIVGQTDGIGGPYSDTSYDICFILTFADEASRQRYNEHPVHQKAATEGFLPLSEKVLLYRLVGY